RVPRPHEHAPRGLAAGQHRLQLRPLERRDERAARRELTTTTPPGPAAGTPRVSPGDGNAPGAPTAGPARSFSNSFSSHAASAPLSMMRPASRFFVALATPQFMLPT